MIHPTPGRVLWFYRSLDAAMEQPQAALVAFVHNDRSVNLMVLDACGDAAPMVRVRLVQEEDSPPNQGPFATWMPYQTAQAKDKKVLDGASSYEQLVQRVAELEKSLAIEKDIYEVLTKRVAELQSKFTSPQPAKSSAAGNLAGQQVPK